MGSLSDIIKNLVAHSPEEQSTLRTVLKIAQTFAAKGQRDLALATLSSSELESPALGKLLVSLPEESRTQFFGLVEALEIYASVHGTAASALQNLNDAAVSELKKLRDICLQGGTHAYY